MKDEIEFDTTWDEIYARGKQFNLYPYTSIVAFLARKYSQVKDRSNIRVLEVGCGAANNLWFAAREGFNVTGLDASADAINFAQKRFAADELEGSFSVGSFCDLPYSNAVFDVVLDRAALTNVNLSMASTALSEIRRVLKPNGQLYSEVFSDHATSRGSRGADGVIKNIEGPYQGAGQIYFYSRNDLLEVYKDGWILIDMAHTERVQYMGEGAEVFAHWSVVAQKVD